MDNVKSNFQLVSEMNTAFLNPKGDPRNIDWSRIRSQAKNMIDEIGELMIALGADKQRVKASVANFKANLVFSEDIDVDGVRDAGCDVMVFDYGMFHLMGINADYDMSSVLAALMTRLIKNEDDLVQTRAKYAANGVTLTYTQGEFPTMVLKSSIDQPDAPKDKFLKAASYKLPTFYSLVPASKMASISTPMNEEARRLLDDHNRTVGAFDPLPGLIK